MVMHMCAGAYRVHVKVRGRCRMSFSFTLHLIFDTESFTEPEEAH